MKLWRVTNGYIGCSDVYCLIIAETKEKALEIARDRFKSEIDEGIEKIEKEYQEDLKRHGKKYADGIKESSKSMIHDKSYYTNLEIECLCEDTSKEWTIGPMG